ncbi:hypothetical protein THAOC_28591, partial [Thalassiosira oceanica]
MPQQQSTARILRPGHKLRPPSSVAVKVHNEKKPAENNAPSKSGPAQTGNDKSTNSPAIAPSSDVPQCSNKSYDFGGREADSTQPSNEDDHDEGSHPGKNAFRSLTKRDARNSKRSLKQPAAVTVEKTPTKANSDGLAQQLPAAETKDVESPPRNDAFKSLVKRDVRNNKEPLTKTAGAVM